MVRATVTTTGVASGVVTVDVEVAPAALDELALLWRSLPPLGPWVEDAACGSLDMPDVFVAGTKPSADELALVERVCRRCPVRRACAEYAASAAVWGVWGGQWHGSRGKRQDAA